MLHTKFVEIGLPVPEKILKVFYHIGLGAKSENMSSVAPPGKRNYIDIMC